MVLQLLQLTDFHVLFSWCLRCISYFIICICISLFSRFFKTRMTNSLYCPLMQHTRTAANRPPKASDRSSYNIQISHFQDTVSHLGHRGVLICGRLHHKMRCGWVVGGCVMFLEHDIRVGILVLYSDPLHTYKTKLSRINTPHIKSVCSDPWGYFCSTEIISKEIFLPKHTLMILKTFGESFSMGQWVEAETVWKAGTLLHVV